MRTGCWYKKYRLFRVVFFFVVVVAVVVEISKAHQTSEMFIPMRQLTQRKFTENHHSHKQYVEYLPALTFPAH